MCAALIGSIKSNTVMGKFIILLSLIFIGTAVMGQNETDPEIEETVNGFFEAMRAGDSSVVAMILPEDCKMQTVEEEEGRVVVKDGNREQFVSVVAKLAGKLDERIDNMIVQQDGAMATVWMEYEFYFEGERHHCGVNAMTMVLREEQWQIIYICDTRGDCL